MLSDSTQFDFAATLACLAETPAEYHDCAQILAHVAALLPGQAVKTRVDAVGNLYVTRPGARPGHLLLCAHVDKNLYRNRVSDWVFLAELETRVRELNGATGDVLRLFAKEEDGAFAELTWDHARDQLRMPQASLYALPVCVQNGTNWSGKFDDAIGMVLILEVFGSTQAARTPTLSALFTVHEEAGLVGSYFAACDDRLGGLTPDAILAVDVCPWVPLGSGVVLYSHCGAYRGRWQHDDPMTEADSAIAARGEPLARQIEACAASQGVTLTTMLPGANDAYNLARYTLYPTVALEVPIAGCHDAVEQIAAADVESMRRLLWSLAGDCGEPGTISR